MRCDIGKKRKHRVVIFSRNRIDLMVVTSGATNRHSEKDFSGGPYYIIQVIISGKYAVGGLIVPYAQSVKSGCGDCCSAWVFDLIPGKLLQYELIVRFVLVE